MLIVAGGKLGLCHALDVKCFTNFGFIGKGRLVTYVTYMETMAHHTLLEFVTSPRDVSKGYFFATIKNACQQKIAFF
jgi:hypothetical protein